MTACLAFTTASCSDDDDKIVTIPTDVAKEMPGTYAASSSYGSAKADSTMTVVLTSKDATFNLPVSNVIKQVVASDKQEEALKSYKADKLTSTWKATAYAANKATLLMASKDVKFSYKSDGKDVSAVAKTSAPTAVYDAKGKTLKVDYTISAVTIDGKSVSGFKAVTVSMPASAKQAGK